MRTEQELAEILDKVEDGRENALLAYARIKALKELYQQAEKQILDYALSEAELHPGNTFELNGFEFTKRNGSKRFSFSHIPEVEEVENNLKVLKEKYKQAFISKQKGLMIASEDGEELILPKISYTKDVLIVKKCNA